ncbi:MAG: metalloregulator ArsR/SmtB family transcription factor [Anaerostipes sp.]|jgi:DNA-binding transcriptional ArsR family regulator|nr:metalloregulator ArsR/SmtB family transcription factor [Anaerostipes sp.]
MSDKEKCNCSNVVEEAKERMLSDNMITRLSSFFKVMGDETRVRMICALSQGEMCEMCVNDLAETLDISQSAISHQLRQLRSQGLVKARRDGKNMFYSLDDDHVLHILDAAVVHIKHKVEEGI